MRNHFETGFKLLKYIGITSIHHTPIPEITMKLTAVYYFDSGRAM